MSSKIIMDHFDELSKFYGYKVIPLHDEINQIARFLRNDTNRIKDAIDLLKMNAINYSNSPIVHETLGDTYSKAGELKNAIAAYEKAIQLDPGNEKVRAKMNSIKNQ